MASIDRALADPLLFGTALGDPSTWATWRVVLKAAFALGLTEAERATFSEIAGGRQPPQDRVRQLWAIAGRRGGKSRMAALISCYLATCLDHRAYLAPGEIGYVLAIAPTQRQAQGILSYCQGFLEASPVLRQEIEASTTEEIRLKAGVTIATHAANFRTVRGRTLLAVVLDETALFRDEASAQPDIEIYRACVPALLTTKGMMVGISTPFGQRGLLFERYRDYFGRDDDEVLVVKGSSTKLNPTLDQGWIDAELARDPEANKAEYSAEFRTDLSAYIDRATVEGCVETGRVVRPFQHRYRYTAFVDPSGGQHDSFTLGIAHVEGERIMVDLTREWRSPFDPSVVVAEANQLLREYLVTTVTGDRYASAWVQSEFRDHGIHYQPSDRDKSQIFLDALPLLTSGNASLLDNPRLIAQISQLQREPGRAGRDVVRKQRGAFDDLANAACGALVYARARSKLSERPKQRISVESVSGNYYA